MTMKGHLDLIGKSLAGAGLTGVVLYIVATATQHSWPYLIFIRHAAGMSFATEISLGRGTVVPA